MACRQPENLRIPLGNPCPPKPSSPIGSSGQGDFWLLRRDGNICWYDHDLGEITPAAIVDFDITFDQFLALSAYLAQIERTLDTNEHYFAAPAHRQAFAHALNHIAQGLFARYPYRYFD